MKKQFIIHKIGLLAVSGFFILSSCSSGVAPTEKLAQAESIIGQAKQEEAYSYAPLEIKLAEDKLIQAKDAIAKEEYEQANILLDQALQDAKLAISKAQSEKAKRSAQEMRDSIETLRRETERK